MLNARNTSSRSLVTSRAVAPAGRPGARDQVPGANAGRLAAGMASRELKPDALKGLHPLTRKELNVQLCGYERSVKSAFDQLEPTLKQFSSLRGRDDFETRAAQLMKERIGLDLPPVLLADAWVGQIDMRRLYAWCVFQTYQRFCNSFASDFPCAMSDGEFQSMLQAFGFHTLDVSPCADGRLAHVISYVLRLPYRSVRRKSYAGAMFDVEDSLEKWVETEMLRFRQARPNSADKSTRYLKAVVYHFSSRNPDSEGCAAHGSDDRLAAESGLHRLTAFKQAVENTYCCGASVELMLIGLDTDTDVIRVHVPDNDGGICLGKYIDAYELYTATRDMRADAAAEWIRDYVEGANTSMAEGMVGLIAHLLVNNLSQIDYVKTYHGGNYEDAGHAERFIGAGIGFEEVQLRNLTYFAYLHTVEEAAKDMDVGIKIFSGLNVSRGLPVPIVVRFDYHGNVPGARERSIERCRRVSHALQERFADLESRGLLHTLLVIKDVNASAPIEVLGCSAIPNGASEIH